MCSNYPELVHKHPTHLDGAGVVGVGSMRFDVLVVLVQGSSSTSKHPTHLYMCCLCRFHEYSNYPGLVHKPP